MKQINNRMRRFTALLMCVCMLLSNVNVAFSDTVTKVSAPVAVQDGAVLYAAALSSAALSDYADMSFELYADRNQTPLPSPLEDGQSLFFQMDFDLFFVEGSDELLKVREAFLNGQIDENTTFTCDINFLNLVGNTNYPTSFDSPDNTAIDPLTSLKVFRWWVDEANRKLCLRFTRELLEREGGVSNTKVAFEGNLDCGGADDNGALHFGVDNEIVSLLAKQEYDLGKTVGVPYYSVEAGSYVVDYTVTLTLGHNMKLAESDSALYAAVVTLVDTVTADSALTGSIVGTPAITAPAGETAAITNTAAGKANTMALSSPDQILSKGVYTITYQMKVDSAAALVRLDGYSEAQKTNTVEVKENGESFETPLTADATIAWDEVTDNQFKIDKNAFMDKAPDYKGVYKVDENYYIDYRVVVYIREPVQTFTVADAPQYGVGLRTDAPVILEGVDSSADYWTKDVNTASLETVDATVSTEIQRLPLGHNNAMANCQVITITAPEGEMLAPGAYHLRIPADVTGAVNNTLKNDYPQYYSNTAYLTSVNGAPANEEKEFKQSIPLYTAPSKSGGYEVNKATGELLFYEGKPVIRWDVWFGWDFYNQTIFEDTMTGMELLVNDQFPFDIHSFTDKNHIKRERLASFSSLEDTAYMDFAEDGTGFTMYAQNLATNPDGTPVKLYKLVYFTTPLDDADGLGYLTSGLKNSYEVTYTTPDGDGFGNGPVTGESEPTLSGNARMTVRKAHVVERNDSLTQWKITCDNSQNKIPFSLLGNLDIVDVVPVSKNEESIGKVTVHYSNEWPITVEMVCQNNARITLVEGTHYSILKQHPQFDFGTNGEYGFAVDLKMDAVAAVLAANDSTYFKTIDVLCHLENEIRASGQNYRIHNEGGLYYTNQGQEIKDSVSAHYDRGFSTKWKGVNTYGDNYNPNSPRRWYVCNPGADGKPIGWQYFTGGYNFDPQYGDGQKEIVWRIFVGAREFGNDPNPITVTVTDTFSDNQMFPTYEGKELKDLFLIRADDNGDYIILPDSVELIDDNTFVLTFTVPGGAWAGQYKSYDIVIDYHTILKPEAIKEALDAAPEDATSVTVNYDNAAVVSWNGASYDDFEESTSHTFSTIMLDKTSSIITAVSEIEYQILINEEKLYLNGGEPLVLTDELGEGKEGFLYRDDSVQLINVDTGAALTPGSSVTGSTYTITWSKGDTKGFTISVPDGQKLQLTYRVKPMTAIGSDTAALANSASLDGKTDTHTQDSFRVSASNQEATYTPPEGSVGISIRKLEGGSSIQILLSGAEFTAYTVNADGTLGDEAGTWITDANGKAMLTFRRNGDAGYDTVYCLKETAAPEGYLAHDGEWYFYFSTDTHEFANDQVEAIVKLLRENGKYVQKVQNQTVHQMNVENLPVTCDLRIRKTDMNGADLQGAVFGLQDSRGNQMPAPATETVDGITYYVFEELKGGNYTLTEVQPPVGYRSGEQSSWNITLDAVQQTVTINWAEGVSDDAKNFAIESAPACLTILNQPALPAELEIPVIKTLDGADTTDAVFSFTLQPVDAAQPMPAAATVTTEGAAYADGSTGISFGPIQFTYDMIGEVYTYRITENTVAGDTGFTGSADVYEVDVAVLWKNNAMAAEISAIRCGETECEAIEFINTFVPFVSISGIKTWSDADDQDGLRPESITLNLLANGSPAVDGNGDAITLDVTGEGDSWSWSFTDLPKFENGAAINYTVTEETVEGYECQITGSAAEGFVVANTHEPEVTEATIIKVWEDAEDQDGIRPENLTVTLLGDGETVKTVTLNETNSWTATVENLPKKADGVEIVYSWSEDETALPEGYSLTGSTTAGTVTTLTNSYSPETTEATIIKVWDDADDQDGIRPENLTVTLLGDGETVKTVTLNETNSWTATVENLPKKADGVEIAYTWSEDETALPEGYSLTGSTTAGTVTTLTNSYSPEVTEATIIKVWEDEEDQDGIRPENLTVTLLADGETVKTVTLNETNSWTATVENLPKKADGVEIVYTWSEDETALPEGYSLTGSTTAGTVTTLTNSYSPEVTEATIIKVWEDEEDQDGIRPENLTVTLLGDGETVQTVTLNETNSWTATVENLPKKADGVEIVYSWSEDETALPEGYSLTGSSTEGTVTTLTNSYSPEVTEATIIKVWEDEDDQDGIRPENLTVTLLADGETVKTVTLNAANSWTATVANLPKKADGVEIAYTWSEDETALPEGYSLTGSTTAGTVTTLTNSYSPEVTEATIIKVWEDEDDQDGIRPENLTVTLLADGETVKTVTLNAANSWTATVENLPKKADGVEIVYTWSEDETTLPEGYSLTGSTTAGTVTTLTNSYSPEVTEATIIKVWEDEDDQDGIRPENLTVTLLADGETVKTVTLNETNSWTATVENLPKKADGVEIVYSWSEDDTALPEGYILTGSTTAETVTTLTNSYSPEVTEATIIKVWEDEDDQDGIRPENLTVTLLADGETVKTVTLNETNSWTATVENLPKKADGVEIVYTWSEDETALPEGYSLTGSSAEGTVTTLTNSYSPEVTEATIIKVWEDEDDQDGIRPENLTVTLLGDGETVQTVTLNETNSWTATVANLPKKADGVEIVYTWSEDETALPEGYSLTGSSTEGTVTTLTNSYSPEVTEATIIKVWEDEDDQDGIRPKNLTVTLLGDGETVQTVTLNETNSWTATVENLPKKADGVEIVYTWSEDETALPEGYSLTGSSTEGTVTTLTNSYSPEVTEATIVKVWEDADDQDGIRPENLTVTLLGDGETVQTVTLNETNSWTATVENLPKKADGVEIAYTWSEDETALPEGYSLTGSTTAGTVTTLTNSYTPETVTISGEKIWDDVDDQDGLRPESVTINLLADGEKVADKSVTIGADGKWSFTFEDLPACAGGERITYTVTEETVTGYTAAITGNAADGFTVKNTHKPAVVSISVSKSWNDGNNQDGLRPDAITVNLLADGEVVASQNIAPDGNGNWSYTFADLPKFKAGVEIGYTITENSIDGYQTGITGSMADGFVITNTRTPDQTSVSGVKTWDDAKNQDGLRPVSILITLYADGEAVDTRTVTEADQWSWSFTGLPQRSGGVDIEYTIGESDLLDAEGNAVDVYTTQINGYNITNSYTPETVDVSGSKEWDDDSNRDNLRPESITINLLADGVWKDSTVVTPDADGNWSWSFTGLPKYRDAGTEIVYTVTEESVTGYTATVTGYDVTNTHTPETIDISGSKTWDDDNNRDGLRPESITINLLADGKVVKTVTVTPDTDGNWSWSFTELPKYETGKVGHELTYTIEEVLSGDDAANYTATVTGYDVTNTHTPETVDISGSKTWDDMNDVCGKRPESITIRLLADGIEIASQTVTADDDWSWSFTDLPMYQTGLVGHEISYTISEDAVPGYTTAINGCDVTNTLYLTGFLKLDEQTGRPLSGAEFALYAGRVTKAEGEALERWTSDGNVKLLAGLTAGETYTIIETRTPAGFVTMRPFVFTVQQTDTPDSYRTFTAENRHIYRFRKLDSSNNGLVYNAMLRVMMGDTVIDEWFSSAENDGWHSIADERFVPGVTYTLVELVAPEGYLKAEPVNFTIDPVTGLLIVGNRQTGGADLVMYDQPAPKATPTPEPTTTELTVTKRWEDQDDVLGLRPATINLNLFRKTGSENWPSDPFMTVTMADNGTDAWTFTFSDLPRRDADGKLYTYMVEEEPVEGYTVTYLNNGRTIVNSIPQEDLPPTPTPTLPYVTPTPAPSDRPPVGVKYVNGEWVYVDEYGIPLGIVPQTGDYTSFSLWGMAILLPMLVAALAAVEISRRKRLMASYEEDPDE